jgi:hypothetical protein
MAHRKQPMSALEGTMRAYSGMILPAVNGHITKSTAGFILDRDRVFQYAWPERAVSG